MAIALTYNIGFAAGGANREDLHDFIENLSPTDTPFMTTCKKTKVNHVKTEWLTDSLSQAASNAVAEGTSAVFSGATARTRLFNYTQICREAYEVSDTQRAVNPAGIADEFRYQMGKGLKQLKRNMEHDLINGTAATGGPTTATVRTMQGAFALLKQYCVLTATASTASSIQETTFNTTLQKVWVNGGMIDTVYVTPAVKSYISTNYTGSTQTQRNISLTDRELVNVVDFYMSDFGNIRIVPHRWFSSAAAGLGNGNATGANLFVQHDKWLVGFLRPVKNTPLAKLGSSERAMVESELTLICTHPSASTFVSGCLTATWLGENFPST